MIKLKIFKSEPIIDYKNFKETGSFRNNDKFAMDLARKANKKLEALKETKK